VFFFLLVFFCVCEYAILFFIMRLLSPRVIYFNHGVFEPAWASARVIAYAEAKDRKKMIKSLKGMYFHSLGGTDLLLTSRAGLKIYSFIWHLFVFLFFVCLPIPRKGGPMLHAPPRISDHHATFGSDRRHRIIAKTNIGRDHEPRGIGGGVCKCKSHRSCILSPSLFIFIPLFLS
jgi:hypothetical protein